MVLVWRPSTEPSPITGPDLNQAIGVPVPSSEVAAKADLVGAWVPGAGLQQDLVEIVLVGQIAPGRKGVPLPARRLELRKMFSSPKLGCARFGSFSFEKKKLLR